jgi:hypothetical protein
MAYGASLILSTNFFGLVKQDYTDKQTSSSAAATTPLSNYSS